MVQPCRECKDRQLGCHDRCNRYAEWKQWHQQCADRLRKQINANADANSFLIENQLKHKKRKGLRK